MLIPLPRDHVLSVAARRDVPWDVLAFIGSLDIGGCERHLANIYPRLAAEGLKVGIVTLKRGGALEEEVRAGGVDVMSIERCLDRPANRARYHLGHALHTADLYRLLRDGRVGVAHFFLPAAYVVGGMAAVLARHPNPVMSRRSLNDYQREAPVVARIERFLHGRMRVLTANARACVEQLVDEGAPAERTVLLPNGVDFDEIDRAPARKAARARFGLAPETIAITVVANLIPYKGHADLMVALGGIAPRFERDWVLLVAGRDDGPARALADTAAALGIAANIRWLGQVCDVPALLRAADLGVLPSHQEGSPNSLLESMAAGVPMVATKVGGVSDLATDEVDALLVPPRDPGKLGAAIFRLMQDSALRARLGAAAAAQARRSFSLRNCVDAYLRLYTLLLHQPILSAAEIVRRVHSTSLVQTGVAEAS